MSSGIRCYTLTEIHFPFSYSIRFHLLIELPPVVEFGEILLAGVSFDDEELFNLSVDWDVVTTAVATPAPAGFDFEVAVMIWCCWIGRILIIGNFAVLLSSWAVVAYCVSWEPSNRSFEYTTRFWDGEVPSPWSIYMLLEFLSIFTLFCCCCCVCCWLDVVCCIICGDCCCWLLLLTRFTFKFDVGISLRCGITWPVVLPPAELKIIFPPPVVLWVEPITIGCDDGCKL